MVEHEKDTKDNEIQDTVPKTVEDEDEKDINAAALEKEAEPILDEQPNGVSAPAVEPPVVVTSRETVVVANNDQLNIDTSRVIPIASPVVGNGTVSRFDDDATVPTDGGNENECIEVTTDSVFSQDGIESHPTQAENTDGVAVALPLNEDQLVYEARRERDDQCCTVVVWWLRPILNKITRRNAKWVALGALCLLIAIILISALAGGNKQANGDLSMAEGSDADAGLESTQTSLTPSVSPSIAVSSAPSTVEAFERIQNITSFIEQISPNDLFKNVSTSQGRALNWILHEDEIQADSSYPTLQYRYALMVLYFALKGENWIQSSGYGTEPGNANFTHECTWFGVDCSETGVPQKLVLVNNNLMGTVPEEIALFGNLTSLELFQNNIGGTIPESAYTLEHLTKFYVYGNVIQGTLSTAIGNLQKLTHLSVRTNKFEGTIPSEIGLLQNLIVCRLYSNNFTGGFPGFIGNNTKLLILNFGDNKLEGPLSPDIGNLTFLKNLYFYDNNFTGTVPKEWRGLSDLRKTGMWTNQLTGTFPTEFSQLPNLLDLSIGRNNFHGPMPYASGLEELWIYQNGFSGPIPTEIGTLKALKLLSAWNNSLSGHIPEEIGNLTSIITLELSNNKLSGEIPSTIEMLGRAITVDLSGNQLSGEVPESLATLPVLNALGLHSNDFSGTVPVGICDNFMNKLTSDCEEVVCDCCTCCYGEDGNPTSGEC